MLESSYGILLMAMLLFLEIKLYHEDFLLTFNIKYVFWQYAEKFPLNIVWHKVVDMNGY